MSSRRFWAAACVSALALAGCGGETHRGDATPSSTTATTAQPRAGSDALPDGFPAEVPVIKGDVKGKSIDVPGSNGGKVFNLTVTGGDAGSFDEAEQLLRDTGFQRDEPDASEPKWTRHPCDRQSRFTNDASDGGSYIVALCGSQSGPGYALEYTVNVYPKDDWQIPQVPPPPGPPQPPR